MKNEVRVAHQRQNSQNEKCASYDGAWFCHA